MTTLVIDKFRRQIIVKGLFARTRIDLVEIESVRLRRSCLFDSLPNPIGVVIPVYEVVLRVRDGRQVPAYGGTSLLDLRRQAVELADRLTVHVHEEHSIADEDQQAVECWSLHFGAHGPSRRSHLLRRPLASVASALRHRERGHRAES